MKLEFDKRMKPTIKSYWKHLHGWRPGSFWWRVGCTVKVNRVRHNNYDKIITICHLIDKKFPHYKERKQTSVSNYSSSGLPRY